MDTVKYRLEAKLPSQTEMRRDGLNQKGSGFYKNIERGNCVLKLQTSSLYGREFVSVEMSAPKLLYGSNVEMVTADDLEYLNASVTSVVAEEARCIPFEAGEAEITRLDLAWNFQTGSESYAHAYRDAMKSRTLPYMRRDITAKKNDAETVYWSNKSRAILVYPKFAETRILAKKGKVGARFIEQSRGMIRLEDRFLNRVSVGNLLEQFGYNNRADAVVPHLLEITRETLRNDMEKLRLDTPIEISNERDRADRLREACGNNFERFIKLNGFLNACDIYGENNLVAMGMNSGTFGNRKRELASLGIVIAKSDRPRVLPALSIPSNRFNKSSFNSVGSILPAYTSESAVCVEGAF